MTRTLVANASHPEVDQLAAALARAGMLSQLVRPYTYQGRRWERLLQEVLGEAKFRRSFGRRQPPESLGGDRVKETAVVLDFLHAGVVHGCNRERASVRFLEAFLLSAKEKKVDRVASRRLAGVDAVAANFGSALRSFQAARRMGITTVLNYPIAHHAYASRLLMEEARLVPSFASTLDFVQLPPRVQSRYEEECALADTILVGSHFARDSFVAEGFPASKLRVIPYGVDLGIFSQPANPEKHEGFQVLFVGQIGQRKGISYLLDAYASFRRPDTRLKLVGRFLGPTRVLDPYSELFDYQPHLPRRDLPGVYAQADVFVLPTILEGLAIVVLEAMACGVPVITTSHGPSEVVRDGVDGFIVPIRDPEAIAEKLRLLYSDPELRRRMSEHARQRAAEFSWRAYQEKIVSFFSGLGDAEQR
jgi:glycosyltransferase involved in cell wall biosynthesis